MKQKVCLFFLLYLVVFFCLPITAYPNSAEPPALIIILKNAPGDVTVSIVSADSTKEGRKSKTAWETYYTFYRRDLGNNSEITLRVSGNDQYYEQTVEKQYLTGYNSIITLDFAARTISPGKLLSRSILLVTLRVFFTLAIEGVFFFLFGFRHKRSWIVFLGMNILTQGFLNIVLNGASPFASYLILTLIFIEFWIFLAEILGALIFIKEHRKIRRISYVLMANTASLVLGSYLITRLPI